jgi:hypothetical protein
MTRSIELSRFARPESVVGSVAQPAPIIEAATIKANKEDLVFMIILQKQITDWHDFRATRPLVRAICVNDFEYKCGGTVLGTPEMLSLHNLYGAKCRGAPALCRTRT